MICSKKYTKYTFSQKNLSIGLNIKGICIVYFGCTLGVLLRKYIGGGVLVIHN